MTDQLTRTLSQRKINFPVWLRGRYFLVFEPEACAWMSEDAIHVYNEESPPTIDGTLEGEVRRCEMTTSGQLTIPASFVEKTAIDPDGEVDVVVEDEDHFVLQSQ